MQRLSQSARSRIHLPTVMFDDKSIMVLRVTDCRKLRTERHLEGPRGLLEDKYHQSDDTHTCRIRPQSNRPKGRSFTYDCYLGFSGTGLSGVLKSLRAE